MPRAWKTWLGLALVAPVVALPAPAEGSAATLLDLVVPGDRAWAAVDLTAARLTSLSFRVDFDGRADRTAETLLVTVRGRDVVYSEGTIHRESCPASPGARVQVPQAGLAVDSRTRCAPAGFPAAVYDVTFSVPGRYQFILLRAAPGADAIRFTLTGDATVVGIEGAASGPEAFFHEARDFVAPVQADAWSGPEAHLVAQGALKVQAKSSLWGSFRAGDSKSQGETALQARRTTSDGAGTLDRVACPCDLAAGRAGPWRFEATSARASFFHADLWLLVADVRMP